MNKYLQDYINTKNELNFLVDNNSVIEKSEAMGYVRDLASAIQKKAKNEKSQISIVILLDRQKEYLLSMFSIWELGGYFIPLNTKWPEHRLRSIIEHAKPDLVICHKNSWYQEENALFIEDVSFTGKNTPIKLTNVVSPSDLAYIIYTSGSTGEPKGVCISYAAYESYIQWTQSYFGAFLANKALLITAELTFDITMGDIAFAFAFGTSIHIAPDPANIFSTIKMIEKHNIDTFYSVPTTHQHVFSLAEKKASIDLSSINLILSGGESFSPKLVKLIHEILPAAHFYNVYGPTEVTINCTAVRLDNQIADIETNGVTIGTGFDHLDGTLLSESGLVALSSGQSGELCIAGSQVMNGYYDDDQKNKDVFIYDNDKKYYKTGDIVEIKSNNIYILCRNDDLIKIKGYRINPNEVSKLLMKHDDVKHCETIHVNDGEPCLYSFVKLKSQSISQIKGYASMHLPSHLMPKDIISIQSFPTNNSGKVDKQKLKNLILENKYD